MIVARRRIPFNSLIGLPEDQVRLRPYTLLWKWLFYKEWLLLRIGLLGVVRDIQHIGSTAIHGMLAKPIIDIAAIATDYEQARPCTELLLWYGYVYRGENESVRLYYFTKGNPITHHLYVYEEGSQELIDKLQFRDYLKQHPDTAQAYAELKQRLVRRYPADRQAYQDAKAGFVRRVLTTAHKKDG
jgi:GrpB-like predicted nucleotidyltransferase (UPF0157 family)